MTSESRIITRLPITLLLPFLLLLFLLSHCCHTAVTISSSVVCHLHTGAKTLVMFRRILLRWPAIAHFASPSCSTRPSAWRSANAWKSQRSSSNSLMKSPVNARVHKRLIACYNRIWPSRLTATVTPELTNLLPESTPGANEPQGETLSSPHFSEVELRSGCTGRNVKI